MPGFYLADHQHKGSAYAQALVEHGWTRYEHPEGPDLVLALYDHDQDGRWQAFERLAAQGVQVMIYPHSARPIVQWDGIYPIWPGTSLLVTIAAGHLAIMERIGFSRPIEACGWPLCEIKPWQSVDVKDRPIEVVFAPIHPNHNGYLHHSDRAMNGLTFQKLLETPGINLTVRHVMRADISGIWQAPGVKYIADNPNGCTREIDQADVVIGHQTFAYLAAARGKPLIMMGDDLVPHSGNHPDKIQWVKHYRDYREEMRYPAEVEAARSGWELRSLMDRVMSEDVGSAWRERFIGQAFDGERFLETVERYL